MVRKDSELVSRMTAEQQARDMLERMGVKGAQEFASSDLVELANLINNNSLIHPRHFVSDGGKWERFDTTLVYTPKLIADERSSQWIGEQVRRFLKEGNAVFVKVVEPQPVLPPME